MRSRWLLISSLVVLLVGGILATPPSHAGGAESYSTPQSHTYLILSNDFWQAMEKLAKSGVSYGDKRESLLEQIAVSSQFAVKTNLTLIKQNERIINLLEELNRRRMQEGR